MPTLRTVQGRFDTRSNVAGPSNVESRVCEKYDRESHGFFLGAFFALAAVVPFWACAGIVAVWFMR